MNGFDLSTISNCFYGSQQVSAIYLGSTKIWPTHDYSQDYLTIVPRSTGYLSFWNGNTNVNVKYSLDGGTTWRLFPLLPSNTWKNDTSVEVQANQEVLINYDAVSAGAPYSPNLHFTAPYDVKGNIMSFTYGDNFRSATSMYKGWRYFGSEQVVNAKDLYLPNVPQTIEGCKQMFSNCTSLVSAPVLRSTTLADNCYQAMFEGCTSLVTPPDLPATTLAPGCYNNMFRDCTALTSTPILRSTSLAELCYLRMFYGCTSLTTITDLPATTLAPGCYALMFHTCTSLTNAPSIYATTLASPISYYSDSIGCCSAMFQNCTSLVSAPDLLATTLTEKCYQSMFYNCSSLEYVKCLATDISATDCTSNWLKNVAASGTFVKDANTTWTTGVDGIPSGWTVQNA